jgi:ABC-2 type transport system permease protein
MLSYNIFIANLRREFIYMRRYLPNTISELIMFYIVFLGFFFGISLVGDPTQLDYNIQLVTLNYVFWFLVLTVTQGLGWEISNEAGQGTLEQLSMTPHKLWVIMLARMTSTIIINMGTISILLLAAMLTSNQWLNIDLISIIPLLLVTLIGVFGLGYILAGITIVLKQVDYILQLFQFVIMAMTFVPLTVLPILKYAPFIFGLQLIRDIAIKNLSIFDLSFSDILFLIVNSGVYFIIGITIFKKCEKLAKLKGLFGHY